MVNGYTFRQLFGWVVLVQQTFVTIFDSISARIPEREREKRWTRGKKKCQKNPNTHLLQAQ